MSEPIIPLTEYEAEAVVEITRLIPTQRKLVDWAPKWRIEAEMQESPVNWSKVAALAATLAARALQAKEVTQ